MENYSLYSYGSMIGPNSKPRVDAFAEAMRKSINPQSVVVEIGTGVGFFAMLAAQYGARHVYAIDYNDAVHTGRKLAEANGLSDRITFIQGLSTNITLPEKADIIISDMRGSLPLLNQHIPSIIDARQRFLAPDGILIPQRDTVWAAVVEAPELYAFHVSPWNDNGYGLDLSLARDQTTNHRRKGRVKPEQLLVEPEKVAILEYSVIETPNVRVDLRWDIARSGTGHGMSMWFDTELLPGIGYSNSPDAPHMPIYSQLFFPWSEIVDLTEGDRVEVKLRVHLTPNGYVWSWNTIIKNPASGEIKVRFTQLSLAGQPLVDAGEEG